MEALKLKAVLGLDKSEFDSGLNSASSKMGSFGSAVGDGLKKIAKVGAAALGAATAGVVAFGKAAVETGKDFDKSMSQVVATMGYSVAELNTEGSEAQQTMQKLRDFAREMGATTAFSAKQAADALNYMALAGYDAETSMKMLPNVLNLAAAGNMDLARASDMVTDSQTAFGISLERTSLMVAEMAKAASTGNTSVEQLGDAFLTVGGLAKELNGGFITLENGATATVDGVQELEIALTAMANAGIKGSEAGTHMRNMLLKLASPTADGTKQLEALGVKVFDTEGNMRSLAAIMGDLNNALGDLTQQQKLEAIGDLFNTRDIAASEALLAAVAEDWDDIGEAILGAWLDTESLNEGLSKLGFENVDSLKDSFKSLGITTEEFDAALLSSGGDAEKFVRNLTSAADEGTGLIDVLDALDGNVADLQAAFEASEDAAEKMAAVQLDNLEGDITIFKSALSDAQIELSDQLTPALREFVQLGTTGLNDIVTGFKSGGLEGAMEALGTTISNGLDQIVKGAPKAVKAGMELLGAVGRGIVQNAPNIVKSVKQIVIDIGSAIVNGGPSFLSAVQEIFGVIGEEIINSAPELLNSVMEMIPNMIDGLSEVSTMLFDFVTELIQSLVPAVQENFPIFVESFMQAFVDFTTHLRENFGTFVDAGIDLIMSLADGLIQAIPTFIETVPTIVSNIAGLINDNAPKLLEAGLELIVQLGLGLINAIPVLIENIPLIFQAIWDVWTAINWIELGTKVITFIKDGMQSLFSDIPGKIKEIGDNALEKFKNIDWKQLGRDVLNFIKNGIEGLKTEIPRKLKSIAESAVTAVKEVDWLDLGKNIVTGIANGIARFGNIIMEKVLDAAKGAFDAVKKFFGISSPSKLMRDEVGKWIPLGLAEGIEENLRPVNAAMEKMYEPMDATLSTEDSRLVGLVDVIVSLLYEYLPQKSDADDILAQLDRQLGILAI